VLTVGAHQHNEGVSCESFLQQIPAALQRSYHGRAANVSGNDPACGPSFLLLSGEKINDVHPSVIQPGPPAGERFVPEKTRDRVTGFIGAGFRGGAWNNDSTNLRVSDRNNAANTNANRNNNNGFRAVRSAP